MKRAAKCSEKETVENNDKTLYVHYIFDILTLFVILKGDVMRSFAKSCVWNIPNAIFLR